MQDGNVSGLDRLSLRKSLLVFGPMVISIIVVVACVVALPDSVAFPLSMILLSLSEFITILLLLIWRKQLIIFAEIGGWLVVMVAAFYLIGTFAAVTRIFPMGPV